jgi:hypothetical protein
MKKVTKSKTIHFHWIFMLAAFIVLLNVTGLPWYAALGIVLLAACDFSITSS